ncbi:MAG: OsmC family protein [Salibacteraceae bacterium]
MNHEISFKYNEGMSFTGEVNGHSITIDAEESFGGNNEGPRPKALVLVALIGCTSMDVVSLLKKMRVPFKDLKVTADGELTEEHPKYYHKIHLTYNIWGENLDTKKVEKAVQYSQERYCGVTAMLEKASDITYEIVYH